MKDFSFDVVILGGGSAGYAAARTTTAMGATTAIIEGGDHLGGLCILRGCMPSKTLLESSHRWHAIQQASAFGLEVQPIRPHFDQIIARKKNLIADFAEYRSQQLQSGPHTFLQGNASFLDPHTLLLSHKGKEQSIQAKTIIISTGSLISQVSLPGLAETGFINSDQALNLTQQPQSLIVLGGGVIAVELGQYFAGLGTQVTLIQRSSHLVKEHDVDISTTLEESFRQNGIDIYTETSLLSAEKTSEGKAITFLHQGKKKRVQAEEIFYALGREPNLTGLHLEKTPIKLQKGRLLVNDYLETSSPHIFAAGDVTGLYEIVHIAIQQGEIAGHNAALLALEATPSPQKRKKKKTNYRLKANVIFTEPEIASVGMSEKEAQDSQIDYLVATYPFDDHGKSIVMGATQGFVKILAEKERGEIIGAQIIGPHASDLIHELIAVMYYRGTVQDLASIPHYHPTLAEIITYPAEELVEKLNALPH